MSFPGTEHYRKRAQSLKHEVEVYGQVHDLREETVEACGEIVELCDHIDWQQCHIEALGKALRASGERREAAEQEVEDLQKKNEQAWERAAEEARRVLKNGSKARKLEKKVEDQDKEIERLRERERHFAKVLGVADEGQYRHDWDGKLKKLLADHRCTRFEQAGVLYFECVVCGRSMDREVSRRTESSEEE